MGTYRDLKFKDFFDGTAKEFCRDLLLRSDAGMAEGEYDLFGGELDTASTVCASLLFMYRFYFRVDVHDVASVPAEGPGLIVSNHAPILPFDAMMIVLSVLVEPETPRYVRAIVNHSAAATPFGSVFMNRTGQVIGSEDNVRRLFESGNLILVFPTGAETWKSSVSQWYRVHDFKIGFMEYALRYGTPVVPACVTGSEESALAFTHLSLPQFNFKYVPITPTFPWLGLAGLIPYPAKFDIYFNEPVPYHEDHAGEEGDPEKVRVLVDDLRDRIQEMLDEAPTRRRFRWPGGGD